MEKNNNLNNQEPPQVAGGKGARKIGKGNSCKEKALAHFGYDRSGVAPAIGIWPNDGDALIRLGRLPEVLRLHQAEKKKIRIVFDYDPDFPKALLQIWGLELATLSLDMNSHEGMPTK